MHPLLPRLAITAASIAVEVAMEAERRLQAKNLDVTKKGFWENIFFPALCVCGAFFASLVLTLLLVLREQSKGVQKLWSLCLLFSLQSMTTILPPQPHLLPPYHSSQHTPIAVSEAAELRAAGRRRGSWGDYRHSILDGDMHDVEQVAS